MTVLGTFPENPLLEATRRMRAEVVKREEAAILGFLGAANGAEGVERLETLRKIGYRVEVEREGGHFVFRDDNYAHFEETVRFKMVKIEESS